MASESDPAVPRAEAEAPDDVPSEPSVKHAKKKGPGSLLRILSWVVVGAGARADRGRHRDVVHGESQLSDEHITVSDDADHFGGDKVDGPLTAYSEAQTIEKHALEAGGGKTYAELDQEDPVRDTVMTASFLRASLFTSVVSFGVAAFAFGMGLLMILIGYILFRLSSLIVEDRAGGRRRRHLTGPTAIVSGAPAGRCGAWPRPAPPPLGRRLVGGVEREAARHQAVAGRGGAVAERAADERGGRAARPASTSAGRSGSESTIRPRPTTSAPPPCDHAPGRRGAATPAGSE